jgi:hypothetical protein
LPFLLSLTCKYPTKEQNDPHDDDYIARVMGIQAAVRINNVIARVQPIKLLLGGLSDAQKSYIRAHIPESMIIEIDKSDDVVGALAFLSKSFTGTLACRSSEIVQGLLLAKNTNKRLSIDDTAPNLESQCVRHGKGLVVI